MSRIGFLHTAEAHVGAFRAVLSELDPAAGDCHVVDPSLLADVRVRGVDAEIQRRLLARLRELAGRGADVILCTCTSLGGAAELNARELGLPVVRIDRPMAERAVANGGHVALVVVLASSMAPSRDLLEQCAAAAGTHLELLEAPCLDAWALIEAGDHAGFLERIAGHVRGLPDGIDVIVLAQASMSSAAALLGDLAVPVLTSPRLAVRRALELAGA